MGCGVSRLDGHGIFFRRMEDLKIRNPPLLNHSKKELLLHDPIPDENASSNSHKINAPSSPDHSLNWALKPDEDPIMEKKTCDKNDDKDVQNDRKYGWMDADNEDAERMIGHDEDDGAFPGSPSFRVYFKEDDEHDDTGKNDAFRDKVPNDDAASSKECSLEKKVKSERKKRSFRKALTKGLNVKSCYTSPRSTPDRTHLLIEKTTA